MSNQKEQMLTAEFYSEGIVVGESLFLGNYSMAKNLKNYGTFSPIMAVTRRIMAKGPKILATDSWHRKTRQLRCVVVRKLLVLNQFNLGWPRGARLRGTQLTYNTSRNVKEPSGCY
jgi:hypothetical protein